MGKHISNLELAELAYVSSRIESLRASERRLKDLVADTFPEGRTVVETDAGPILVHVWYDPESGSTFADAQYIET